MATRPRSAAARSASRQCSRRWASYCSGVPRSIPFVRLLAGVAPLLADRCVAGIQAHPERLRRYAESCVSIVTALNGFIGYEAGAEVAKQALRTGSTIREVVIERGHVESGEISLEQLDAALDVLAMTRTPQVPGG